MGVCDLLADHRKDRQGDQPPQAQTERQPDRDPERWVRFAGGIVGAVLNRWLNHGAPRAGIHCLPPLVSMAWQ